VSIYATFTTLDPTDHPTTPGLPYQYLGSHILPTEDGPRDGDVQLAEIPSHITRDGRDDQPEDGRPWPWLRMSVDAYATGASADVVLDVAQARYLAGQLTDWADRVEGCTK
jgi:hypothetical protein